jgi:mannose-6-phosphate isomerase
MKELYPLKFKPIFKDKIWGGDKLKTFFGKDFSPLPNCGESWEISGMKNNASIIDNGSLAGETLNSVLEKFKEDLVGKKVYKKFGSTFPLLVKFIDANDDLSIQVHPNDKLAKERHNSLGKTEMWYVIQADPGSTLISGFSRPVNEHIYLEKLNSGHLTDILNKEEVKPGDVFLLPAGRVHTIGKGLLIAEIQESSDITYRIFDFDRKDANGKKRELHTEEAIAAIDYNFYSGYKTLYKPEKNKPVPLIKCPHFTTQVLEYTRGTQRNYTSVDSFIIHICINGSYSLFWRTQKLKVKMGECVLLPAITNEIKIETSQGFKILESCIE